MTPPLRVLTSNLRIFMKFLLLFLGIPLLEIVAFVQIGGKIGALWTVLLTVGTAILGAFLVRTQGIRTLLSVKDQLAHGELPAQTVVEGIILLVCGALLLTPGFISDTLGFLGLVPAIRSVAAKSLLSKVFVMQAQRSQGFNGGGHTIEGQFRRED
jgi:UPF0716 protein FxsA